MSSDVWCLDTATVSKRQYPDSASDKRISDMSAVAFNSGICVTIKKLSDL